DINQLRDLPLAVAETPIGQTATVKVWRDGHDLTLSPVIAAMPANPQQQFAENGESNGSTSTMGLSLTRLTPEWRQRLHVEKDVKGVVVTHVANDSPLASLGVQEGDVIEAINRQSVDTPEAAAHEFDQVKNEKSADKSVLLLINRHGINQYVAMSVEENGGGGNG
ncbi:MAG TPA: PDZ domain-containing protein, partial [Stellaceae bacterium]|nr:PDZ domain-containing protein [Stellaceae bacterium]